MKVITNPADLAPFRGCTFVPTMGALHEGHATLIRRENHGYVMGVHTDPRTGKAIDRPLHDTVVVSIFVNPTQFNDPADLARYPRTLEADLAVCEAAGADAVFVPEVETIYPRGLRLPVPPLPAAATEPKLEDALRPGHFAGVCQVVARLFDLVKPYNAVFGEKDYQQLAVINAMTDALRLPVFILPIETVREPDGLAMSSRNRFIPPDKRSQAAAISRALCEASAPANTTPAKAEAAMRHILLEAGFAESDIQYAVVRDAVTLTPTTIGPCRSLIAVKLGPVRLIDNAPW
ncbi:MAG: pantoate--beta-alanine ligase [Phycisphaerales bacterium]